MKKYLFTFLLFFIFLLFDIQGFAAEPGCPGTTNPNPNTVWCEDFSVAPVNAVNGWEIDAYCCYDHGNGIKGTSPQSGVITRGPQIGPGSFDPGPCDLTAPGICGTHNTVFSGPQGFQDNYAAWSDYYWVCCGSHYFVKMFYGAAYTEGHIRWYTYYAPSWCINAGTYTAADGDINPIPCGGKLLLAQSQTHWTGSIYNSAYGNGGGPGKPVFQSYLNDPYPCVEDNTADQGVYYFCALRLQNRGNDLIVEPGNWYLYEYHFKINDVGSTNGVVDLWIDKVFPGVPFTGPQTLRLRDTDVVFRTPSQPNAMNGFFFTPNNNWGYCRTVGMTNNLGVGGASPCPVDATTGQIVTSQPNAYLKWDNVVFRLGNTQIGGMGGTQPTPPALLEVH